MARVRRSALFLAIAASQAGCDLGLEDGSAGQAGAGSRAIVNGQATTDFSTTGVLLVDQDPPFLVCSGTLIGCDRFLTAAHCVCTGDGADCQDRAPDEPMKVYLQNAGFFAVVGRHVHPAFSFPDSDIAVLELDRPAVGLVPSPLPLESPTLGQDGVIVGYGRSGGGLHDYGIKQFGPVVTAGCPADAGGPGHVCWDYLGEGANTCNGDSGGPLFVESQGRVAVAGITSGGVRSDCLSGDQSYDNDVFAFIDFVRSAGGELGPNRCGQLPSLDQDGAAVVAEQGALVAGQSVRFEVDVPPGTAELRVALNATEGSDPVLQLGRSVGPSDCTTGPSAYTFCQIRSPEPGAWAASVGASAAGEFQLTMTTLAGAPRATADSYEAVGGSALEVAAGAGVLANDAGSGRAALMADIRAAPLHGEIELRGDGSFTYRPEAGYEGADSFTYSASDGTYFGTAAVSLAVAPAATRQGGEDGDRGMAGCAAGGSHRPGWLVVALLLVIRRRRPR